ADDCQGLTDRKNTRGESIISWDKMALGMSHGCMLGRFRWEPSSCRLIPTLHGLETVYGFY
ncbi:hypothetical protein STEG23_025002, partial [Scotinomys teguina]